MASLFGSLPGKLKRGCGQLLVSVQRRIGRGLGEIAGRFHRRFELRRHLIELRVLLEQGLVEVIGAIGQFLQDFDALFSGQLLLLIRERRR